MTSARERVIAWWHAVTRTSHDEDGAPATAADADRASRPSTDERKAA